MPGGVAVIDFDGDGLEDLFFANGAPLGTTIRIGKQVNRATSGVGYASSSNALVQFGLGAIDTVDAEITPLGGKPEVRKGLTAGRIDDAGAR